MPRVNARVSSDSLSAADTAGRIKDASITTIGGGGGGDGWWWWERLMVDDDISRAQIFSCLSTSRNVGGHHVTTRLRISAAFENTAERDVPRGRSVSFLDFIIYFCLVLCFSLPFVRLIWNTRHRDKFDLKDRRVVISKLKNVWGSLSLCLSLELQLEHESSAALRNLIKHGRNKRQSRHLYFFLVAFISISRKWSCFLHDQLVAFIWNNFSVRVWSFFPRASTSVTSIQDSKQRLRLCNSRLPTLCYFVSIIAVFH